MAWWKRNSSGDDNKHNHRLESNEDDKKTSATVSDNRGFPKFQANVSSIC